MAEKKLGTCSYCGEEFSKLALKKHYMKCEKNVERNNSEEKEDYFHHFLENKPVGKIDYSHIEIGCNTASDAGIYTFTYGTTGKKVQARYSFNYQWDGKNWLISQHHSSAMPEKQ